MRANHPAGGFITGKFRLSPGFSMDSNGAVCRKFASSKMVEAQIQ